MKAKYFNKPTEITEYRLVGRYTRGHGFGGHFLAQFGERLDVNTERELTPVALPGNGNLRTTLAIDGGHRNYAFPQINWERRRWLANKAVRCQAWEFGYYQDVTDRLADDGKWLDVKLDNTDETPLQSGGLGDRYTFKLDDTAEQLIWFEADILLTGSVAVRFVSKRNQFNSWMVKLFDTLQSQLNHAGGEFTGFNIEFSQMPLQVSHASLVYFQVEELYGKYMEDPLVPLEELNDTAVPSGLVRRREKAVSPMQILSMNRGGDSSNGQNSWETVEVATLVFQPGYYRDLAVK